MLFVPSDRIRDVSDELLKPLSRGGWTADPSGTIAEGLVEPEDEEAGTNGVANLAAHDTSLSP